MAKEKLYSIDEFEKRFDLFEKKKQIKICKLNFQIILKNLYIIYEFISKINYLLHKISKKELLKLLKHYQIFL